MNRLRDALLVLAPAVIGGVVLWLVRPGVVENAARSPVAWLVGLGILAAAVGVRALAVRLGARPLAARVLSSALALALIAVVLAPSFRQRTLVEDLPDALVAATPTTTPVATASPRATRTPASARPTATSAPTPAAPVLDRSGPLDGIGHSARGTVRIRTAADGTYLLFEDVDIEGTVEPSVHLVPDGRRTPRDGVRIGDLKAEKGTFAYRLPEGIDLTRTWSVLVWCDPYDTPIAAADPR
jgi:hypothetical protein